MPSLHDLFYSQAFLAVTTDEGAVSTLNAMSVRCALAARNVNLSCRPRAEVFSRSWWNAS